MWRSCAPAIVAVTVLSGCIATTGENKVAISAPKAMDVSSQGFGISRAENRNPIQLAAASCHKWVSDSKCTPLTIGSGNSQRDLRESVTSHQSALSRAPATASVRREMVRLPVRIRGNPYKLEAQVLTPPGTGPRPLAIIAHGSPRKAANRKTMTTHQYFSQAMEFARRGYVTAIVLRRNYGRSQGKWFETFGRCETPNYDRAVATTANDIIAAISTLTKRSEVDGNRVLVVGQSAGGIGAVAVAARNPHGVVATINFAGGRGSLSKGKVCNANALVSAYRKLGKTAKIPSLWVYTQNDSYFGPTLSRQFYRAFSSSGGKAEFVLTESFGKDGHRLFSRKGIKRWRPLVDNFLRKHGLPNWNKPPPLPRVRNVAAPAGLSKRARRAWENYLAAESNKAFARSTKSKKIGWRSSRNSIQEAKKGALRNCKRDDCVIVSTNGSPP